MKFFTSNIGIIVFIFILNLSLSSVNAQDRENKSLPIISKTVLWSLTGATGWVKSMDGQWLSSKNKILTFALSSADMSLYNKGKAVLGFDNFSSWEARDIVVEGKNFLLLTKAFSFGKYQYPNTREGLIIENSTAFMVIKKNSSKFENSENSAGPNYHMPLFYYGIIPTSLNTLKDISIKINEISIKYPWISTSEGTTDEFTIFYAVNKDPKLCRFFTLGAGDIANNRLLLPQPNLNLFYSQGYAYFKNGYFELPTANFAGLLNLIKPSN